MNNATQKHSKIECQSLYWDVPKEIKKTENGKFFIYKDIATSFHDGKVIRDWVEVSFKEYDSVKLNPTQLYLVTQQVGKETPIPRALTDVEMKYYAIEFPPVNQYLLVKEGIVKHDYFLNAIHQPNQEFLTTN